MPVSKKLKRKVGREALRPMRCSKSKNERESGGPKNTVDGMRSSRRSCH